MSKDTSKDSKYSTKRFSTIFLVILIIPSTIAVVDPSSDSWTGWDYSSSEEGPWRKNAFSGEVVVGVNIDENTNNPPGSCGQSNDGGIDEPGCLRVQSASAVSLGSSSWTSWDYSSSDDGPVSMTAPSGEVVVGVNIDENTNNPPGSCGQSNDGGIDLQSCLKLKTAPLSSSSVYRIEEGSWTSWDYSSSDDGPVSKQVGDQEVVLGVEYDENTDNPPGTCGQSNDGGIDQPGCLRLKTGIIEKVPGFNSMNFQNSATRHAFNVSSVVSDEEGDNDITSCDLAIDDNDGNSKSYTMNLNRSYGNSTEAKCTYSGLSSSDDAGWGGNENMDVTVQVTNSSGKTFSATFSHSFPNHQPTISASPSFSDDTGLSFDISAMVEDTDAGSSELSSCTVHHDDNDGNSYTSTGKLDTNAATTDEAKCTFTLNYTRFTGYIAGELIDIKVEFTDKHGSDTITKTYNHSTTKAWAFTTCGKVSGRYGPTQNQCDSAYSGTTLEGDVTIVGPDNSGYQEWDVPYTGKYRIKAAGAKGGEPGTSGAGDGAIMRGEITLSSSDTLLIAVGQRAQPGGNAIAAGGGGTFVTLGTSYTSSEPLIVAGGGGGYALDGQTSYSDASTATYGKDSESYDQCGTNYGAGGNDGNGGDSSKDASGSDEEGDGGAGFYTDGQPGYNSPGPKAFRNGLAGGKYNSGDHYGGFGGGGGGYDSSAGGGGYSGGGGADWSCGSESYHTGGGGGSFIHNNFTSAATSTGSFTDSSNADDGYSGSVSDLNNWNSGPGYVAITLIESKNKSVCDKRGSENECVATQTHNLASEIIDISSIFTSKDSAKFTSTDTAVLNVSNNTFLSGFWKGSFEIRSEKPTFRSGASFRPENGNIVIGE